MLGTHYFSSLCASGRKAGSFRFAPSLQILVYLYSQNISRDPAPHRTTRLTADKIVAAGLAGRVGQHAIQLWVNWAWRKVRLLATGRNADRCPQLLAPLAHYPAYNYPLPYSLLRMYQRPRIL